MAYDVGTAVLHVVPSFRNIEGELKKFADDLGKRLSKSVGTQMTEGLKNGLKDATITVEHQAKEAGERVAKEVSSGVSKGVKQAGKDAGRDADDAGEKIGKKLAGALQVRVSAAINRALDSVGEFQVKVQPTVDHAALNEARRRLTQLQKKPAKDQSNLAGLAELRSLANEFDRLSREASSFQLRFDADAGKRALEDLFNSLQTDAEQMARAAAKEQQRVVDAAHAEALRLEETFRRERQRIIDVAHAEALREEEQLERDFLRIAREVHAETLREHIEFERERERIAKEARVRWERAMAEQARAAEQAFGRTWAGRIRKQITDAFGAIPDLRLGIDATDGERRLRAVRDQLVGLSRLRVGVDISTEDAQERIQQLRVQLFTLANSRATVEVRAAAAEAAATLLAIEREIEHIDGRTVTVNADVDAAGFLARMASIRDATEVNIGRLGALIVTITSLGPALVPLAAAAVSTIGAIGTAIAALVAGVGVLALGFSGVFDAVKALNDYQQQAEKSAVAVAAAQARVASATDAVTAATRSLANVRASAASAARRAAEQIAEAERGVGEAREAAAEAVERANRRIADSERSLARAQEDAKEAREALTEAQRDAVDAMADLDSAVKRNALDQREANLEIAKAKAELDKFLSNPRATQEQIEQAKIVYERRLLQIQDLKREGKDLAAQQAEAAKDGVEGSEQVRAARERIADADQRVADTQRDLADARAALVKAQLDGVQRVADAEKRVADAQRAAADQQRQSAFAIAQAQQGLIGAQRQLQQALKASGVAGGEAFQNLKKAMDNLSPAGQRFARFLFSLKPEFDKLRATAADNLLPGVQASIENILPHLPKLNEFVGKVAKSLGGMFEKTTDLLTNDPTWRRFFDYVGDNTVPILERLFRIGEKVMTGLIGLFNAFTPFNEPAGQGLEDLATKFADWATSLEDNKGFQEFLDYVKKEGPAVIAALKELAIFTWHFVVAAAPIGIIVIKAFTKLFELLNKIPTDDLTLLIGAIVGVSGAIGLLGAVTAAVAAGSAALIIAAIGALSVGIIFLIMKVDALREAYITWDAATRAIFSGLYNNVLKPISEAIAALFTEVIGPAFLWLYYHVFLPYWQRVKIAFDIGVAGIKIAFGLFQIGVKLAGAAWRAFYDRYIYPVWKLIEPLFKTIGGLIDKEVTPRWSSAVDGLGKIWDRLNEATKVPIRFVVNTVLNDGLFKVYNEVAKRFHVKPDDVRVDLPKGFATGGAIRGAGTGVSDSILARLSNGEHVWTAAEVRAAGGHQAVESLRQAVVGAPGFRRGGGVGDGIGDLFKKAKRSVGDAVRGVKDLFTDPIGVLKKLAKDLLGKVPGQGSLPVNLLSGMTTTLVDGAVDKVRGALTRGEDGGPTGGVGNVLGGSAGMMRLLRAVFPGLRLISGFRPGSRTLSGSRSYHASDRAIDTEPREDVARHINQVWGGLTKELITPFQRWNLLNGRPHRYTGAVWAQHNFAGGNAHDHWAYDSGGMLPPGVSTVVNRTGQPEPVLNPWQWDQIATLARNSHAERTVQNHYHFRQADLDIGRLQAIQARQDALARAGRPR